MRTIVGIILIIVTTSIRFGENESFIGKWKNSDFTCKISTSNDTIKVGETPQISVSISNNSIDDVFLIGSLDGSEAKWRFPYCYYSIEKPKEDTVYGSSRCGNMNTLRTEDFVLVKSGESFDPYMDVIGNGFFSSHKIQRKIHFKNPGTYKIQFHYNSNSNNLEKYMGSIYGNENKTKLKRLLKKVPRIKVESNILEIVIVE